MVLVSSQKDITGTILASMIILGQEIGVSFKTSTFFLG